MIYNLRNKKIISNFPFFAENFLDRLFGLIGETEFSVRQDAMVFPHCGAVHCFFMRMAIDIVFVDRGNRVVMLCPGVKPWKICMGGTDACCAVELPEGTISCADIRIGDQLDFKYFFVDKSSVSQM